MISFIMILKQNLIVDDDVKKILDAFPKAAHPMGVISSLNKCLNSF